MEVVIDEDLPQNGLNVLQVEDDPADAVLTETLLRKAINVELQLSHAESLSAALDLADSVNFDAIILDLNLPDATGVEAVQNFHNKFPDKAIVVMTGSKDDVLARRAMLMGAQDYLVKGDYSADSIWRSLRYAMERKRFERRLETMAKFDSLTGLINRSHCLERISYLLHSLNRYGGTAALLFLDLDKFKWINDNLGHDKGDELLLVIAERLKKCVRQGDVVARMGGDEFVMVLERVQHPQYAAKVAEKLIEVCNLPICIDEQEVYVGASIGIAMSAKDCLEPALLLKHADLAMYRAKDCGRNNFQFYSPELNVHAKGRAVLANSLHGAIENGELELFYQPKVKVSNNTLCGAEVLLRWNHVDSGLIMPDVFIPLLEETGLIISVGDWVLRTAAAQYKAWFDRGLVDASHKIAVNLSARQFMFTDLTSSISEALEHTQLPPDMLELELTESMLLHDSEQSGKVLTSLRSLGVNIAIDDFGTGYSCLSNLKRYPINQLKIDKSFMANINNDMENSAICRAVISLAQELGISVTAEGVENQEALDFLKSRNCEHYQGFYYSPAITASAFEALLIKNQT